MSSKPAKVTGQKPTVHNRLRSQFGVVQIAGHNRLAAHGHFSNSVRIGLGDFHFDAGQGAPDRVRAKGLEIIDRNNRARLGETISVGDGYAEALKEFQSGGFREGASDKQGAQLAAERLVNLLQEAATEREICSASDQDAIHGDQAIQNRALRFRQIREAGPKSSFQIL